MLWIFFIILMLFGDCFFGLQWTMRKEVSEKRRNERKVSGGMRRFAAEKKLSPYIGALLFLVPRSPPN